MSDRPLMLFRNVHLVMKADRLFRDENIFCRVVPVPEVISSECGMCLVIDRENVDLCCRLLEEYQIPFEMHNS
ncbi:MAG: DUF3343 domain-containing protein [Marinilabilia sp.]